MFVCDDDASHLLSIVIQILLHIACQPDLSRSLEGGEKQNIRSFFLLQPFSLFSECFYRHFHFSQNCILKILCLSFLCVSVSRSLSGGEWKDNRIFSQHFHFSLPTSPPSTQFRSNFVHFTD